MLKLKSTEVICMDSDSKRSDESVREVLKEVYNSLMQRGYNPINQLAGYLVSNDLGYISNYKGARNKLSKLDRNTIIEVLLEDYLK